MLQTATQIDLERRLVGAVLLRGDAFYELPADTGPQVLTHAALRSGFEALERWSKAQRLPPGEVDLRLLASDARLTDGDVIELQTAAVEADSPYMRSPVVDIARALIDRHRRSALMATLAAAGKALQGAAPTDEIAGKLVTKLLDLDGGGDRPEVVSFREAALNAYDVMERQKSKQKGPGSVVRTGFADIDALLKIRKTNLIVLGARPGVGKTTLALDIADNVAQSLGHVLCHSLEMADAELVTLAVSRATEIDSETFFDDNEWPQSKWEKVSSAIDARLHGADGRLWINDSHYELGAICRITEKAHRKLKAQNGVGLVLVVLDYLQLVEVTLGKGSNREQQIATISRTLKRLAMRLQLPVLALSQLNRAVEQRNTQATAPKCARCGIPQGKHSPQDRHAFEKPPLQAPKLHDLRESGAIEQDANAVVFLHNPYAESDDIIQRRRGPYELIVAKQRLGKKGKVRLWGDLEYARFRPFSNQAGPAQHWTQEDDK